MLLVDQEIVRGLNENPVRLQDVLRKMAKIGCDDDISPFVNSGGHHMLVMRIGNVRYSIEQILGNGNRSLRKYFAHTPEATCCLLHRIAKLLYGSAYFLQSLITPQCTKECWFFRATQKRLA